MEISTFDAAIALIMVSVTVGLIAWFRRSEASGSMRRMTAMMDRIHLNIGMATDPDPRLRATMDEVERRCSRCPHEGLCERWLAREVSGPNVFCANVPTFRALAENTGRSELRAI